MNKPKLGDGATPGPWLRFSRKLELIGENNVRVAFVEGRTIEEQEANIALIAKAPLLVEARDTILELLKALDVAIDRSDLETGDTFGVYHNKAMDTIDAARALLAKLEG